MRLVSHHQYLDKYQSLRLLDCTCANLSYRRIQKTDGCEHMTCKKCKHEFCWLCLCSHSEIKRVGNTAHKEDCKFHSDNLKVSWPFNYH